MLGILSSESVRFGSQEFFDQYKKMLNDDQEFRKLGTENHYTTREMVFVNEVNFGYLQSTNEGLVEELRVVKQDELSEVEQKADLVYHVPMFETILKLCKGESTPVKLVLGGKMKVKGGVQNALKFYPCISRSMKILENLCASGKVILPKSASEFVSK